MRNRTAAAKLSGLVHKRHKFRLLLCGHKAVEAGTACLVLMVQGQLAQATFGHVLVASQTGVLTVAPLPGITLTRYARHFANKWISAILVGGCAFLADAVIHSSHYPGKYTEAALTSLGAAAFSLIVSFTPLGRYIDRLAEDFAAH